MGSASSTLEGGGLADKVTFEGEPARVARQFINYCASVCNDEDDDIWPPPTWISFRVASDREGTVQILTSVSSGYQRQEGDDYGTHKFSIAFDGPRIGNSLRSIIPHFAQFIADNPDRRIYAKVWRYYECEENSQCGKYIRFYFDRHDKDLYEKFFRPTKQAAEKDSVMETVVKSLRSSGYGEIGCPIPTPKNFVRTNEELQITGLRLNTFRKYETEGKPEHILHYYDDGNICATFRDERLSNRLRDRRMSLDYGRMAAMESGIAQDKYMHDLGGSPHYALGSLFGLL